VTTDDFADRVAARLVALPTVQAVALGGSRAAGRQRPDSDWDFAIYYRGEFDPQTLRDIGWTGEVSEIGGWGGGVFNGGAWLQVEDRRVDVHYRDLNSVERELAEAIEGRFRVEPLLFHLAGIPSYLIAAELATCQVLRGHLPRIHSYPTALRVSAPQIWWGKAESNFDYARANHACNGQLAECIGLLAQATCQAAHAVLAARGEWVTNEKNLLTRADLRAADRIIGEAQPKPPALRCAADKLRDVCAAAVHSAVNDGRSCLA
jgi:predicted nucleotidyltransferase